MSDQETVIDSRRATFNAATQRLHPYKIAKALNRLTRGLDWCGCTKKHMREEWASGEWLRKMNGQALRDAIDAEVNR